MDSAKKVKPSKTEILVKRAVTGAKRIKKGAKLNLDAIIGEKAVVVDKIQNIAGSGQVKVHNQIWSARSSDPDVIFEEGDVVSVVAIEGVKLICK